MVAGLEEISEGDLLIGTDVVNALDPRKRDVAMVFQNYALYPHMTIFDNIAFPLRSRRMPREQVVAEVERVAAMLGLTDQLKRRPRTLSGGQRQRVAMGRALVRQPQVFLMDEPLSNLDAKLRVQMRAEISRLQRDLAVTTIYVTHDQVEALTMGTRIAVMRKGVLQQEGPPQELYDRPRNLFVATFIGSPSMNLLRGRLEQDGDGLACVVGEQRLQLSARGADGNGSLAPYVGRDVALGIRPEHLSGATANGERPRLRGEVQLVEALGSERLVHVTVKGAPVMTEEVLEVARDTDAAVVQTLRAEEASGVVPIVARFDVSEPAEPGREAELAISPEHVHVFDLDSGAAIR
jgi:multiple sugar transport system ATP-binding protein